MTISKITLLVTAVLTLVLCSAPVKAVPTIQFAQDTGSWVYTPQGAQHGMLTFTSTIVVTQTDASASNDALKGAIVNIPSLKVTPTGDTYKLTATNGGKFSITDATGKTTFLTGTLGTGNLIPNGTTAGAYTVYQADITSVTVNNKIGSPALKRVSDLGEKPVLNVDFALSGANMGFKEIIQQAVPGKGAVSGSASVVPAPSALLLGSLGVAAVGWLRRRKTV